MDFPASEDDLVLSLTQYVFRFLFCHEYLKSPTRRSVHLNMPEQFVDRLKTVLASSQSISSLMRNISYLAIFISPLLLLHPKKFDQTSIRKDALIAVSPLI